MLSQLPNSVCIAEQFSRFTPGAESLLKWAYRASKVTEDWHCGLNDLALRKCRILLMAVIVAHSWNESRQRRVHNIKEDKKGGHYIAGKGYKGVHDKK